MVIAGLLLVSPFLLSGRPADALALLLGLYFLLFSVRQLMPAAIFLVFLSAEGLGIFAAWSEEGLPYLQLMPGMRVTIRDALLLGMLPVAVMQLRRRGEVPVFTKPLLGVAAAIGLAFMVGVLLDGDTRAPLNLLRPLFGYALYFIIVAAVDSRRKLNWFLASLFGVVIVAVAIQVYEAYLGAPLPFLALPLDASQAQVGINVDGRKVPYLWNRARWQMFLCLLLALGCLFEWRSVRLHAGLAVICLIGFMISLSRSWYVFIAVGILVMLLATRSWRAGARFGAAIVIVGSALWSIGTLTSELTAGSYGASLTEVWLARSQTLLAFEEDHSYQSRVSTLSEQWDQVLASPLFGYGLSRVSQHLVLQLGSLDTGAVNTLLVFGFIGLTAFLALIAHAVLASITTWRQLPPSRDRGYALGLLGAWTGLSVGYAFNVDFLTHPHGPWVVVLALAIGDRLRRLNAAAQDHTYTVPLASSPAAVTPGQSWRDAS